jgi:hypothetical protein
MESTVFFSIRNWSERVRKSPEEPDQAGPRWDEAGRGGTSGLRSGGNGDGTVGLRIEEKEGQVCKRVG